MKRKPGEQVPIPAVSHQARHQIFLSYATPDQDLVENFAARLLQYGVKAWVYSIDKTLSDATWGEIETRIDEAEVFAFAASVDSCGAHGQRREFELAIEKVHRQGGELRLLPIVLRDFPFSELPTALQRVNGFQLDAYNVESMAHQMARRFFPDLFDNERDKPWKCPKPGQWLEVHLIDPGIEGALTLKDPLYFRRLSPMGLFECYSPKLNELFWIMPENVRACEISQDALPAVPEEFHYMTSIRHEMRGRNLPQGSDRPYVVFGDTNVGATILRGRLERKEQTGK